jgi:hypothetical protein
VNVDATGILAGISDHEQLQANNSGATRLSATRFLVQRIKNAPKQIASQAQPTIANEVLVDETQLCDSGSLHIFGTLNNDATGTLAIQYNDCRFDEVTLSGQGSFRADEFDSRMGMISDFTVSFSMLTMRGPGLSVDVAGSLRAVLSLATQTEAITSNLILRDNLTGEMTKSENFVYTTVYDSILKSIPVRVAASATGRVFNSVHGYINVTTINPFTFSSAAQAFPDNGQIRLTGAGNRGIRVTAISSLLARLGLDLDGNSLYESEATLKWTDVSGAVGTDLADDDGDGMHNSWEQVNGLNPQAASDAALDNDGDFGRNLAEYRSGTDPNDDHSVAPAATFTGQVVSLPGNSDLIYDPVTQKLYAAVRGNPGSVVPINPSTGALGTAIQVGIDPVKLARSDNGQYLYVALDGEAAVQRINLATQTVDLTIPLGEGSHGPLFAKDMAVLPGNPQSVAISLKFKGTNPDHAGVAVYDGAVRRDSVTPGHTGSDMIEFSASSGTLYGYSNESSSFGFYRMAVDATGVSILDVFNSFQGDLIQGFYVDIAFHQGLIYATTGRVIDPVTRTIVGTLAPAPTNGYLRLVEPDASSGRVFSLNVVNPGTPITPGIWNLITYDINTLRQVGMEVVTGILGKPDSLLRWGSTGLAFRTSSGQIFFTETSSLLP